MASDSEEFEAAVGDTSEDESSDSEEFIVEKEVPSAYAADESDDDLPPTQEALDQRRLDNIKALQEGVGLQIERKPLISKLLTVDPQLILKKPFKSPHPNAPHRSEALKRSLVARKTFVPWGANAPFKPLKVNLPQHLLHQYEDERPASGPSKPVPQCDLPPGIEPLVLWEPPEGAEGRPVVVDNAVTRFLRPHQREGVQFMFECVAGLKEFDGFGCILADDMGLGKTLQGISLLWTLLNNGHELLGSDPLARRIVICCPTSLVSNWDNECTKWLNGRVKTLPLQESCRDDVISALDRFLSPSCPAQLLIASYETFRIHAERFTAEGTCDLLICDEAHRLKNDQTLTNQALAKMACKRRVLLSGTPMQNQLQEFYSMVNFCNPGVLGTPSEFRKYYEVPVLAGREPDASESEQALGAARSDELSKIVNDFILRRTNTLLSAHLPPKVVEVVCCKMTPLQYDLYCHYVQSRSVQSLFDKQKAAKVLSAITSIRKLLNHPKLIYDMMSSGGRATEENGDAAGFANCAALFPQDMFVGGRGGKAVLAPGWEDLSGKFGLVARMLALLREQTKDRVVIVSNFTQTLDLFTQLCRDRNYPCLRLDGSITIKNREKLVKKFNDMQDNQFVFLLSSKAGGCGLNLIGGNRLILFDMSWNPADDKQAAARVWRDGQRRLVFVYRLMTTGTIEEKIYQRQLSKEGLQQVVDSKSSSTGSNAMSLNELRDLFSYDPETLSTTYDGMVANVGRHKRKEDKPVKGGAGGSKNAAAAKKKAQKKKKRQSDWSSSSDEEEEEEEMLISDDEEQPLSALAPPPPGRNQQQQQEEDTNAWDHNEDIVVDLGDGSVDDDGEEGGSNCFAAAVVDKSVEGKKVKKPAMTSAAAIAAYGEIFKDQDGEPKEEDLAAWGHHSNPKTVPDDLMTHCGGEDVSFVFSCKVKGRDVPPDAPLLPLGKAKPINHGGFGGGGGAFAMPERRVGMRNTTGGIGGTVGSSSVIPRAAGTITGMNRASMPVMQQRQQPPKSPSMQPPQQQQQPRAITGNPPPPAAAPAAVLARKENAAPRQTTQLPAAPVTKPAAPPVKPRAQSESAAQVLKKKRKSSIGGGGKNTKAAAGGSAEAKQRKQNSISVAVSNKRTVVFSDSDDEL